MCTADSRKKRENNINEKGELTELWSLPFLLTCVILPCLARKGERSVRACDVFDGHAGVFHTHDNGKPVKIICDLRKVAAPF